MVVVRAGERQDLDGAVKIWRAADTARRGGRPAPPEHETRIHGYLAKRDAFLVIAEDESTFVGMTLAMQGLDDDGAGPPLPGLCHISLVFVAPDHWGEGIGGGLVDAVLREARSRDYARAQLWTHADNGRAQRLYEGRGFRRSGREKDDDLGERIVHYKRALS